MFLSHPRKIAEQHASLSKSEIEHFAEAVGLPDNNLSQNFHEALTAKADEDGRVASSSRVP